MDFELQVKLAVYRHPAEIGLVGDLSDPHPDSFG